MTYTSTYKTTCTNHSGGPASPHTAECFVAIQQPESVCQHQWLPWLALLNGSSWTRCVQCNDEQQYVHWSQR